MAFRPQLRHMGLLVSDMQAMERYYTEVLGMLVTDRGRVPRLQNREIVFLSSSATDHHQLVLLAGREGNGPSVVNQISFQVESLAQLREMNKRIEAAGISPIRPISHGNSWSIYSADPEGNGIEVYADTPWHVSQPQTHPLDLSQSDEAILASTEASIRSDKSFARRTAWIDRMEVTMGFGP
jgi:catechol 2,3-dioxygenase